MGVNPGSKLPAPQAQDISFGAREGFSILTHQFELPAETHSLDPKRKRALTICNLFINHQLGVSQIAQLLEDDPDRVVQALLQNKIVQDRRVKPSARPSNVERRKLPLK